MAKLELIATSTFGIESIVARELKELGYDNVAVENGKVTFIGNEESICETNLWLRCADRVYLKVGEFKATSFEELFQQVKALPWENYLPVDARFPVNAKSVKSQLFSLSDIQAISKKAIVEKMKEIYFKDWFEETGAEYPIMVSSLKDKVTVSIDTSGAGLHKRGYREAQGEAPLKETLAAAMIKISRWRSDRTLIDPLCGSGTIAIEAAMIGRNIAPGLNRSFISEKWDFISEDLWKKTKKEAYKAIEYDKDLDIYGYDIDGRVAKIAMENSIEAGVDDCIHFQKRPVSQLSSKKKYGYIICNPPYGERLSEKKEVEKLYKEMGRVFSGLDTWSYYILTSHEGFQEAFGKKANKNRKLYNGRIKCYYYQYFGPRPPRRNE
ncbi:THUMP domain-containing class I SAM-dependent RNA methyltransferase [Paramaledivibacter caminithermalis]|jgi:putative N6-adenine-specific DNA methylase|uniref:Putative N6-adenine-specific DNA methylase n=1 Tax=Paramaledivibacter caminithermalis (strain DSM 15212 / CIP 107654 / DViRD3) TaxID=1121301 RepID=A0A1M6NZT8_PARC5|nr:class I SAM-dependent RNA methyltransferase [Paramaledivibacter caminithermalis]SHK01191.1 putative N6-adenine-specific DNA methylase [Paramaledivibacter caminithermalis DSM 15212]